MFGGAHPRPCAFEDVAALARSHAGIVNKHIDGTKANGDLFCRRTARRQVRQLPLRQFGSGFRAGNRLRRREIAVIGGDDPMGGAEIFNDGAPNAAAAAGYDCDRLRHAEVID